MQLVEFQNWLDNASFAILFVTMLSYWCNVAFPQANWLRALGNAGMITANLCIAALLGARWIEAGYFPLSNLYESLFFLAWGITTMQLWVERVGQVGNFWVAKGLSGAFTAPVAMGITAFAALVLPDNMQSAQPLVPALKSNWLMMHVTVMLLSYAALMVGSVLAVAFLVATRGQDVNLRGNSLGISLNRYQATTTTTVELVSHSNHETLTQSGNHGAVAVMETPPVTTTPLTLQRLNLSETLDNLSYRMIGLGFPLLTIGIIAGGVWANEAWGSYWSWDPKETWSLITWLVFAAYLHTRISKGWQGKKPAILATVGLGVVWTCYLGVNLLGKGLHSYGWFL
jgi:cytochrome c-type biogenesis protein CcsB